MAKKKNPIDKYKTDEELTKDDRLEPFELTPTKLGRERLDAIRARREAFLEALSNVKAKTESSNERYKNYDSGPVASLTDDILRIITSTGKYGKAKDASDPDMISEFIDAYAVLDRTDEQDAVARKIITIAKSFYEYDNKHRIFIDDKTYDGLLAKFLSNGNIEPVGVIPKGKKNLKKVGIVYPTLHNNVDKAYAIRLEDPIPDGVVEKNCVEKFLLRVYKSLGITSEVKIQLELSPKLDGVSINGTVEGDKLRNPQTRGEESESVSIIGLDGLQVTTMKNDKEFGIQYEAFVTEADRLKVSEYLKMAEPYVSCRHAAAGIISRLSTVEDSELLQFLSLYPITSEGLDGIYEETIDYLQNFAVVPNDMIERKIITGNMEELLNKITKQFQKLTAKRSSISYAIDGMVITVVDNDYQIIIGREGRTNKYQLALKFDPASATSHAKGIWLDTGRKGYRTIQVELDEPVYLDGVRYDHVPVLSADLYKELGLRVGSEVRIRRVGDVIPSIRVENAGNGKPLDLPKKCPTCGNLMMIKAKKLYCPSPECKDNVIGRLTDFFEKLNMDEYGVSFAELLYKKFGVNGIGDLFTLINKDTIKSSGINSKKLKEFPELVRDTVSNTVDYRVIAAIGIPGIGPSKAKMLLKTYTLCDMVKMAGRTAFDRISMEENIEKIVGPETAELAVRFMTSSMFQNDIRCLKGYIKKITKDFNLPKVGHSGITPSAEVKKLIESIGHELVDGKSFDMLLVPNKEYTSGKTEVALKKNLPIFTEEEFLKRFKDAQV